MGLSGWPFPYQYVPYEFHAGQYQVGGAGGGVLRISEGPVCNPPASLLFILFSLPVRPTSSPSILRTIIVAHSGLVLHPQIPHSMTCSKYYHIFHEVTTRSEKGSDRKEKRRKKRSKVRKVPTVTIYNAMKPIAATYI